MPLMFAAAPLGGGPTTGIVTLYELSTLATMVLLVLPARACARLLSGRWIERYGDAVAGGFIAALGLAVAGLGW